LGWRKGIQERTYKGCLRKVGCRRAEMRAGNLTTR
jgi:hypothetical protein